ncbi:MAG: hypothetical protein NZV14_17205 [Bryobacteraceae bacterium]|nr:hypothetical protein [Bryobacteraceae bacterium]MDW8379902.1 hypothetical protein [Bryobacterales bacterium]
MKPLFSGGASVHLGGPDPQGERVSLVDPATGALAVKNLVTGEQIRVTPDPAPGQFAYFSVFSRTGSRIAYAWFNEAGYYELRVVDLSSGKVHLMHRNEERRFVQPCAWTPGDRQILTLFFRNDNVSQLAWVDAGTGAVMVLRSLDWVYPNRMDCSPDGKWIVYDDLGAEGSAQRDIFLLSSDGARLRKLVEHDAHDIFPLFAPDGDSVLFLSNRSGKFDLWRQALERGSPIRLASDLGRALAMGISKRGDYFFARRIGSAEIWVGPPANPRPLLLRSPEEAVQPAWSPDGKQIAFLAKAGPENFGQDARVIVLANLETAEHRLVTPRLVHLDGLAWHPSLRFLLVSGGDRHGQRGLYRVALDNGHAEPIVRERAASYRGFEGVYSSDGTRVFFLQGVELRSLDAVLYSGRGTLKHLALSPDGKWLAFCEEVSEGTGVKKISIEGGAAHQLATVRNNPASGLSWMPSGDALLLTVPGEPASLWRIPTAGGKPERFALHLNPNGAVRWHPNGRWVAYSTGKTQTEVCVLEKVAGAS